MFVLCHEWHPMENIIQWILIELLEPMPKPMSSPCQIQLFGLILFWIQDSAEVSNCPIE